MLNLIKYFVTSISSLIELKNEYLRALIAPKIQITGVKTFTNKILPKVLDMLYEEIDKILSNALTITLITDIWTNKQNTDFIGLAAVVSNQLGEKSILVIGMMAMVGSHSAENIKKCIEEMINQYKFDKKKLNGIN